MPPNKGLRRTAFRAAAEASRWPDQTEAAMELSL